MHSSNIATEFVLTGIKKQRTRILNSPEILVKIDQEDISIYAPNIMDRYEDCPDNIDDMCLTDFLLKPTFMKKLMNQMMKIMNPDDGKSYMKPVAEIPEKEDLKTAVTIKLKDGLAKMRRKTQPIVIRFDSISKLKSLEDFSWRLLWMS